MKNSFCNTMTLSYCIQICDQLPALIFSLYLFGLVLLDRYDFNKPVIIIIFNQLNFENKMQRVNSV